MRVKVELEIEVTGDCSFEDAEEFFRYHFAGYGMTDWERNPLLSEDYDDEYSVEEIEVNQL